MSKSKENKEELEKIKELTEEEIRLIYERINDNSECPQCGTRHFLPVCPYCNAPKHE